MISWVKRSALFVGLAFVIFACEDSGTIGLDLDPERGNFAAKYVEIPLKASVVMMDSIFTENHPRLLVSHMDDPEFGRVEARGYARLFLGYHPFRPEEGSVFDSLMFDFKLNYQFGPKDYQMQEIYVHELTDTIGRGLKFSWDSTAYMTDPIGHGIFDLTGLDTMWVDTTMTIRLADTLGMRFLQTALDDTTIFSSHTKFEEIFNGVALVAPSTNTRALGVGLKDGVTKVVLYYHVPPNDSTVKSYTFNFFSSDGYNSSWLFYHSIKADRSGTALEGLKDTNVDFDPGNGFTYTQSGTGIMTRLSFTPLYRFLDTVSNIIVNRCELMYETEPYSNYLNPPGPTQLFVINNDNHFVYVNGKPKRLLDDEDPSKELFLKFKEDEVTGMRSYTGVISIFTQELISGNSTDSLLVTRPYYTGSTFNRFVADTTTFRIKLYYSELE